MAEKKGLTRRQLLRSSAVTAGALAAAGPGANIAWSAPDTIRVGLIGCGKRGVAAARNCIGSAQGVQVVALADAFEDKVGSIKSEFKIADSHCFVGLDAYKEMMSRDDVDMVILATPPAFRPAQVTEAVEKGKHVFMEAPVAICPAGAKAVVEAATKASEKKLALVAGTQKRHDPAVVETLKRIGDGAIGDIMSAHFYWNQGGIPVEARKPTQSDVEWQLRNWPFFIWLSGDQIVYQLVHQIDLIEAALGAQPGMVHAMGGRQFRKGPQHGDVYDHFGMEFTYDNDVKAIGMCRQIEGTDELIGQRVVGTKGASDLCGTIEGENAWRYDGPKVDPYVQEFADMVKSIRDGNPLNEGIRAASSAMTAVLARESAYSRKRFKSSWYISKSDLSLLLGDELKLTDARPVLPAPNPTSYALAGMAPEAGKKRKKKGSK